MQVFQMAAFNGHLYLGVQSLSGGYSVVRTTARPHRRASSCPASAFTEVVPLGWG